MPRGPDPVSGSAERPSRLSPLRTKGSAVVLYQDGPEPDTYILRPEASVYPWPDREVRERAISPDLFSGPWRAR